MGVNITMFWFEHLRLKKIEIGVLIYLVFIRWYFLFMCLSTNVYFPSHYNSGVEFFILKT